jgi:hypothetical protein
MMDWPERLLIAAIRCMPALRREWGEAMLAELASVRPSQARWRFAIGCAATALEESMKSLRTRVLGVALISLTWATLWALMFGALLLALERVLGPSNEPSLLFMMWTIGQLGLATGLLFGVLLATGENGKAVEKISLLRVTLWGALSAAVFPVMTGRANQVLWTSTFGVIVAVAMVALARQAALSRSRRDRAPSLLSACALLPVKDAVRPRHESWHDARHGLS